VQVDVDNKGKLAYASGVCYFFRSVFEDGCILAFYAHSPCGTYHDMEKGWVVIDPVRKTIQDECETVSMGEATRGIEIG